MTDSSFLRRLFVKNLTLQTATEAVGLACGLLMTLVLSRYLGVAGFGQFNYLFVFLYFFLTFNDLGISTIVVREISQVPARAGEIIGSLLSFRLALGTLSLLVFWGVVLAADFSLELKVALALIGAVLPLSALRLPNVIFQSKLRFDYGAAVEISSRVATVVLVLAAVGLKTGLIGVTAAFVAGEAFGVAVTTVFSRRLVRPVWHIEPDYWRVVLRLSLPLGMATVLSGVVNRVDFLMLERIVDMHQIGLYGAAYKLTNLVERLPQMVVATLYPLMARQAFENPRALRALYRKGLLTLGGLGIAMAVSMTLLGAPIIRIVFGDQYGDAVRALRILVWASACLYAALPGGFALISLGRVRFNLLTLVAGAATNIALNFVLIPRFGYVGAAAATVAAFAVILATTLASVEWSVNRAIAGSHGVATGTAVVTPPVLGPTPLE